MLGYDSALSTKVTTLNSSILGQNQAWDQRMADPTAFGNWLTTRLQTFQNPSNMTYIRGTNSGTHVITNASTNENYNQIKLIRFPAAYSGLLVQSLSFENFTITDQLNITSGAAGLVNPFIGSNNENTSAVSMRGFIDSAFKNIDLKVEGRRDDQYLAGGGIIGLRSTASNAEIDTISGNYFTSIKVTTQNITTGVLASPYIEGGGIIGVNGVSTPALISGHAVLDTLSYNYFNKISIISGDMILGGGVVGINNNAQNNNDLTYTSLNYAKGNIFGEGTDGNITVKAEYSLRGGGVIGVNALSNAKTSLDILNDNLFAGIDVEVGSYLRGGGVVGVQSKCSDTDPSKKDNCEPASVDTSLDVPSFLGLADNNVFYNINVAVGVKHTGAGLDGGGVIGANSYNNSAIINEVRNSLFKKITVNVEAVAGGAGELHGGGVIGASSLQTAGIVNLNNNYFDTIEVDIAKNLHGGGIIGVSTSSDKFPDNLTYLGKVSNNSFKNIEVSTGGTIYGGGIIGISAEAGITSNFALESDNIVSMYNNVFTGSTVSSSLGIYGGGVIGHYAKNGWALVGPIENGDFYNLSVQSPFIEGAGIVGAYSDTYALIYSINGVNFLNNKITVDRYIDGGGIVGVTGSSALSSTPMIGIHEIKNSYFVGNAVTANNGIIMGGLVYSYGTYSGGLTIKGTWFENNNFQAILSSSTYTSYPGYDDKYGVYGTVTIDTGGYTDLTTGTAVVNLVSTPDSSVVFFNNVINATVDGVVLDKRTNSLYFGSLPEYEFSNGTYTITKDPAKLNAELIVDTSQGGSVALFDPILVDQTGSTKYFKMTVDGYGDFLWGGENYIYTDTSSPNANNVINIAGGSTSLLSGMTLEAESHLFNLNSVARLNVMGQNKFMVNQAYLNGTMWFNLAAGTVNDASTALLSITSPNPVVVTGSIVSLGDFPAGQNLKPGDRFYLIDSNSNNWITLDQSTKMATARQGLLSKYTFIIDNEDAVGADNRYLVARLGYKAPQVDEPLVVYQRTAVDEPLVVYTKSAVDEPQMVQFKTATGDPLKVEIHTAVGEPLVVHVKDDVGNPLVVKYETAVGNPNVVYVKTAVGDPLFQMIKAPQVDDPLVVYQNADTGEPLVVYTKTAVGDPLKVELKAATGDPLKVEVHTAVGEPLAVYVKDAVGDPLVVKYETAVGDPNVVYVKTAVGDPLFQLVRDPQVGDPLVVYQNAETGEPLVVYNKTAVGDPLKVEVKAATGDPLKVEIHAETGEPLVVHVKDAVGDPLEVKFETKVDNPEVVYVKTAVGDPLFQMVKDPQVGDPLVVYQKTATGEPLVVYLKTAVDNPLMVQVKTATGDPLMVEIHEKTGEPLVVNVKDAVGDPLEVKIETAVDNPEVVYVKTAVGEPLFQLLTIPTNNPYYDNLVDPKNPLELIHETKLLAAGQAATLGLLNQTWLPDHSYESADLALALSQKAWAPYVGIDFALIESGRDTKIQTDSGRISFGVAWQLPGDNFNFLAAAFVESIVGKYHLEADYGTLFGPEVKGKGTVTAIDAGLMLRHKWNMGLRLEASVRYGVIRNKFESPSFDNSRGDTMDYKTETPFWSVHTGIGYEYKFGERSTLDFVARYFYSKLDQEKVVLNTGEEINFDPVISQRVRAGVRYSYRHSERITLYTGAYWEQEFDGKSIGEHLGMKFSADELKGGTGIGEFGASFRVTPDHPWGIETGFQLYGGRSKGFSLGVRVGYEF
jgi:hypothetical protein